MQAVVLAVAALGSLLPCEAFFCARLSTLGTHPVGSRTWDWQAAKRCSVYSGAAASSPAGASLTTKMQILPEGGQSPCNIKVSKLSQVGDMFAGGASRVHEVQEALYCWFLMGAIVVMINSLKCIAICIVARSVPGRPGG